MKLKRKCKITFIRHGATINTEENRLFDNEAYPPINIAGKYEIEKISQWLKLKGLKTDKIYTGPALRTVQSAQIISEYCKKDFEIINGLTPKKSGIWSGLTYEEAEKKYPDMIKEYIQNPENYKPEGGESDYEYNKRITEIINKIIEENISKRLIIVTHAQTIQTCIANILEIPLKNLHKIYIPTGSATQISYYEDFSSLVYCGYIPILSEKISD